MKIYFENCLSCSNGELTVSPKDDLDTIFTMCRERWGDGRMHRVNNEYIWQKSTDVHGPFNICPTCNCCAKPCKCGEQS